MLQQYLTELQKLICWNGKKNLIYGVPALMVIKARTGK